jgi:acyl-CoA dehydrogenase
MGSAAKTLKARRRIRGTMEGHMDFELPEDVKLLKETVRKFVDKELIPIEMKTIEGPSLKKEYREALSKKAKDLGLWLLDTPAEYGGQGLSTVALAAVWEEVTRTVALPSRSIQIFGPSIRSILLCLTDEMKQSYLLPVLRGEKKTTFAQSEPDAGSDPGMMRTRAVRQGDQYVINGYKRWIPFAEDADFLQVVAATDPAKGSHGGLSVFIVDKDTPGVSIVGRTEHMMGDVTYEIALDDVKVPIGHLIGAEGDGMKQAQGFISTNRIHQACHGLGVAQRCLEMMTKYTSERVTFGRPVASRQAAQFTVADLYIKHQLGQLMTYRTAWKIDQGIAARHETYMTKLFCTELGFEAADRCLQFHGAMGLSKEMPIEQMWRRSRSYMITGGPAEIMRTVIARHVYQLFK